MGPLKHPLQTSADQARDGVDRRYQFCACGAPLTPRSHRCRRCQCRKAQARYQKTDKGKAVQARYEKTPAARVSDVRYRASPLGQRTTAALNAKRIFIGRDYRGRVRSIEQATAINRHIKERVRVAQQRFKDREKAEGVSSGTVSTQAAV